MAQLTNRAKIRRRVCRLTGDCLVCTATSNGTTTTFIDAINGNHESGMLVNRVGIFTAGTEANRGSTIRLSGNTKSTFTFTFADTAVASATATGDELELWNERDEGSLVDEVHDFINFAILDAAEKSVTATISPQIPFTYENPVVPVNAQWEGVTGIDYKDSDGIWHPLPPGTWRVDRKQKQVELIHEGRRLADEGFIRIRGANTPEALIRDTDTTAVNAEWLSHQVAANLLNARAMRATRSKEITDKAFALQQRADQLREATRLTLRGRFIRFG